MSSFRDAADWVVKRISALTRTATDADLTDNEYMAVDDASAYTRKITVASLATWILGKIKSLPTAITAFRTGDVIPVDGPSGTAKMSKDTLLQLTSQNALAGNVAPEFVPNSTNAVEGMLYTYGGKVYRAKEDYSGDWDGTKFERRGVSDVISILKKEEETYSNLLNILLEAEIVEPVNKIDLEKITSGRYLYDGSFQSNSSYNTTDYIPVKNGDVLRFYFKNSSNQPERVSGERLALFNANKNYIGVSEQYPVNISTGYTVSELSAAFVRLSYNSAYTNVELTINKSTISEITEYFNPRLKSEKIEKIVANFASEFVPNIQVVKDSLCIHDTSLYIAKDDYIGPWNSDYFTKISVAELIKTAIDSISDVDSKVDTLLDSKQFSPVNKIDLEKITEGRYLWDGSFQTNSSYSTTDYIPVNNGDVLRFYRAYDNSEGQTVLEGNNGERLALFDKNKNYIGVSGQYPVTLVTGYAISNEGAAFVRLSYNSNFSLVELTINESSQEFYSEYFAPYYDSARLQTIENQIGADAEKIIDCWGDSRTEMNVGTSYTDYLASLLGAPYIVTNRGISGQASGQVGFRMGSNEVFVTLDGNAIPASGSVNVTGVISSVGSREGYNLETADDSRGSHCSLNGISGKFVYHRSGAKTFTRDYAGSAVNVFPVTKLIPDPYFEKNHMQIMWFGKNDFSYSWPYIESGVEANYDAAIAELPHDKFIILGETYSHGDSYDVGGADRSRVISINNYLTSKYPDNFIDINKELVDNGLTLENITPTEQDEIDIAKGWIPSSLMDDATHPNQYGREAIAKIIYAWMQSKHWL